MPLFHCRVIA